MALSPPKKSGEKKSTPKSGPKEKKEVEAAPQKKGKKIHSSAKSKEKKEQLPPVQAWVEKMNKSAAFKGSTQVRMANQLKNPFGLRRPTGKLALDIALGGGMHAGGIIQVGGDKSVGKSYFCWECCAQNQLIYGDDSAILIAAVELRPDKNHCRLANFCIAFSEKEISDMEEGRLKHGIPAFTEEEKEDLRTQIGQVVVVMANTAEKLFDVILDAIEQNIFQLIVIDSLGALLPKAKDDAESLSEKTYGGSSVAVTDFVNKLYPLLLMERPDGTLTETTLLAINQARARIGGTRFERKDKEAMGAYAWKHGQLVDILLERGAKVRETAEGPSIGYTVRWELLKGKVGTHDGLKGSYDYIHFPTGIEPVFWKDVMENWFGGTAYFNEHAETAIQMGVIEGKGWYTFTRPDGKVVKIQGIDNLAQALGEDPELLEEVREACFQKARVFIRNR